ncbi:VCBS repeat-containing protein [Streptomyces sp. NPDC002133]|uniref:FG-GAP repeat domain-containing protein n=1 Tax=Streptomyces sp. NPDC002133 TaxID=3154409 RepID=UPI0033325AFB
MTGRLASVCVRTCLCICTRPWGGSCKDVIGAGDFNGDGRNDLVSRDTSNRLWLNAGTGTGTFANRVPAGDATYWKSWASLA